MLAKCWTAYVFIVGYTKVINADSSASFIAQKKGSGGLIVQQPLR